VVSSLDVPARRVEDEGDMSVELARRRPLECGSLTVLAFERLRSHLIRAALRPRKRLRVHALSERYGTGASAIREALSCLVSGGLVQFLEQ